MAALEEEQGLAAEAFGDEVCRTRCINVSESSLPGFHGNSHGVCYMYIVVGSKCVWGLI
jgi:hypothetical protein